MRLQHLTDEVLHNDILVLVSRERSGGISILHHLREIDRRKLYSDYRCSSLFDYCVRLLGYSEASAQRRIIAARLLDEVPGLEKKIEEGLLNLTNISRANQYFRANDIKRAEDKIIVLTEIENLSKKECEKKLFGMSGKEIEGKEGTKRISVDKSQVSFVLSDETLGEMYKLKALIGRNISTDELLKFMARAGIEKVEKQKFKQTTKPKSLPPGEVRRTPTAAMKRDVYERDQQHCLQCGGQYNLNYDHRIPWAMGGETSKENLRLLCFNCNQRARIKVFGELSLQRPPDPG